MRKPKTTGTVTMSRIDFWRLHSLIYQAKLAESEAARVLESARASAQQAHEKQHRELQRLGRKYGFHAQSSMIALDDETCSLQLSVKEN